MKSRYEVKGGPNISHERTDNFYRQIGGISVVPMPSFLSLVTSDFACPKQQSSVCSLRGAATPHPYISNAGLGRFAGKCAGILAMPPRICCTVCRRRTRHLQTPMWNIVGPAPCITTLVLLWAPARRGFDFPNAIGATPCTDSSGKDRNPEWCFSLVFTPVVNFPTLTL